jgi:hypothetical protein
VNELFTIPLTFIIFSVRIVSCGIPGFVVGHLPAGVQRIECILIMRPEPHCLVDEAGTVNLAEVHINCILIVTSFTIFVL